MRSTTLHRANIKKDMVRNEQGPRVEAALSSCQKCQGTSIYKEQIRQDGVVEYWWCLTCGWRGFV